jgi:hypothetical protein
MGSWESLLTFWKDGDVDHAGAAFAYPNSSKYAHFIPI